MQSTSLYGYLFDQYHGERVSEQPGTPNETIRIEAFSDGVFAIAITLLILCAAPFPLEKGRSDLNRTCLAGFAVVSG